MSVLVPRLPRDAAREIIEEARGMPPEALSESLPREASVQLSPVGGRRIEESELVALREKLVDVGRRHGLGGQRSQSGYAAFDTEAAVVLRTELDISPNEASSESVWTYLTCCWLLDLALWRFGRDADVRRLYGDVNRNTFRRLWWRAEILAEPGEAVRPFGGLGEDELVNIMERPTLARDARLARTIVRVFTDEVPSLADRGLRRMDVMRDLTKRILRLTPFIELRALDDHALRTTVEHQLRLSIAAMLGEGAPAPIAPSAQTPMISASVEVLDEFTPTEDGTAAAEISEVDLDELALDLARRTGRVTNLRLREMVPTLDSGQAREVFARLIAQGRLERRGDRRGTHYVIPADAPDGAIARAGKSVLRRLLDRRE